LFFKNITIHGKFLIVEEGRLIYGAVISCMMKSDDELIQNIELHDDINELLVNAQNEYITNTSWPEIILMLNNLNIIKYGIMVRREWINDLTISLQG
jgi:hypothetical protein